MTRRQRGPFGQDPHGRPGRPARRRRGTAGVAIVLLLGLVGAAPAARAGEVIEVTTKTQGVSDGLCSLQEAIYSAEFGDNIALDQTDPDHTYTTGCEPGTGSGDTIVLPAGTLSFTTLWDGDAHNPFGPTATPIIFTKMTIEGPGTTLAWQGSGHARLFAVGSASITPTAGVVTGTTFSGTGDLTLEDVYVKDFSVKGGNGADGGGGGLGAGGAIYVGRNAAAEVFPSLTVVNSTFQGNGATGGNGAPGIAGGGGGMGGNGGTSGFAQLSGFVGGGGGGARGNGYGDGGGGGGTVFDGGPSFYDPNRGQIDGGPGGYLCGADGGNDGSGDNDGHDASTSCPGGGGGGAGTDFTINSFATFNGGDGSYGGGGGGGENGGGTSFFGGGGGSADACQGQCAGDGGFGGGGGSPDGHGGPHFGGNASDSGGGGGSGLGGAIFNDSGTVVIQNSTFQGNAVLHGFGGGVGADNGGDSGAAIFSRNGSLTVQNSTISDGSASGAGGGIVVVNDGATTTFVLDNTIIANNGASSCILTGTIGTAGSAGNLIRQNANCPSVVSTDDPHLDALALNDPGDTPTMAIHAGSSPAVDAADDASALATDQRTVERPQGPHADIGAYEAPPASADLQLTKDVSTGTALPGDAITYTLNVLNAGPDTASDVTTTDTLPSGLSYVGCSASGGGSCSEQNGTVSGSFASVAANASPTVTIQATVSAQAADGATVANTASASSASTADPDTDNNSATASFTVHNRADLQVTETVTKVPNMHLQYRFSVKNLGPYQSRQITLTAPMPVGTRFVSVAPGPWSCGALPAGSTGTLTCTLAALDANATAALTLDVKVVTVGRNITSTVTVASVTQDPNSANNRASLTTKVGSAKW